jgi:DNA-binding transcriptional MerR regulator
MRVDVGNSGRGRSASASAADRDSPGITIVALAREFGVSLRTLRFYEARGFVSPRREGAVRLFNQSDRNRIALVLQAKRLGFTLREIADLLANSDSGSPTLQLSRQQCTEQIKHLERQKREIEAALAELRRVYTSQYLSAMSAPAREEDAARGAAPVSLR